MATAPSSGRDEQWDGLQWLESGRDVERIVLFSDAVFAIAITLLALQLTVPNVAAARLGHALAGLGATYASYAISFAVIAIYWVAYHRDMHFVDRFDGKLLVLNLLFLASIAFLPFPTAVQGRYGTESRVSVVFYAAALAVTGLLLSAMWAYASSPRRKLVGSRLTPEIRRYYLYRGFSAPLIFGASIGIAFLSTNAAVYSWILLALSRRILLYLPGARPRSRR